MFASSANTNNSCSFEARAEALSSKRKKGARRSNTRTYARSSCLRQSDLAIVAKGYYPLSYLNRNLSSVVESIKMPVTAIINAGEKNRRDSKVFLVTVMCQSDHALNRTEFAYNSRL